MSLQVCAIQSSFALDPCSPFFTLAFIFFYYTFASSLDISLLVSLHPTYQEKAAEVSTPSSKQRNLYWTYFSCLTAVEKHVLNSSLKPKTDQKHFVLVIPGSLWWQRLWVTAQRNVTLLLLGVT